MILYTFKGEVRFFFVLTVHNFLSGCSGVILQPHD